MELTASSKYFNYTCYLDFVAAYVLKHLIATYVRRGVSATLLTALEQSEGALLRNETHLTQGLDALLADGVLALGNDATLLGLHQVLLR